MLLKPVAVTGDNPRQAIAKIGPGAEARSQKLNRLSRK